jgi:hypothetical protein
MLSIEDNFLAVFAVVYKSNGKMLSEKRLRKCPGMGKAI